MKLNYIIGICLLALLYSACKSTKPVRPVEEYEELMEERISVINIPVDISVRELETSLNQQLKGVLYEDKNLKDGDNMRIRAEKRQNIRLGIDSQLIKYRVPLSLWIQYDLGISRVEAEGEIALDFKTAFDIRDDWRVVTTTEIIRYDWLDKPRLKMGMVNLPIGFIADLVLQNSKQTITRSIDELVREQFNLREMVNEAWEKMYEPMLVSEEYSTWLAVNPQSIGMTPLLMERGRISGTIQVESKPKVRVGLAPAGLAVVPLPPLKRQEEAGDDFIIHINTEITYEEAERIAKAQLVGETFSQGKQSVVIKDIELYGQGKKIVVNTVLAGSYNGSIYLAGEPVYDPRKNTLDIENLDYTLDTRSFLVRSAGWLLKSAIKNRIEDNMNFLLDYNLQEMKTQFQEQLEEYKITEDVLLNGHLEGLSIQNAYLAPDAIIVDLALKGNLNVRVKGLN